MKRSATERSGASHGQGRMSARHLFTLDARCSKEERPSRQATACQDLAVPGTGFAGHSNGRKFHSNTMLDGTTRIISAFATFVNQRWEAGCTPEHERQGHRSPE